MDKTNFFDKVYKLVKRIPPGKVVTYGQIAEALKTKDARKVGWALHANSDPNTPCHRVVNKDGRLAPNYGFSLPAQNHTLRRIRTELKSRKGRLGGDGEAEQRRRLLVEGVGFTDEGLVDLKRHNLKVLH